ncbi:endonuclease/exonuclease/phosphatase family protein [Parasphingorhabdus sp. DH2-15]|uniref:endonuclease/exonuclease/phosphatase family protein n=1 Tax=Parasphingorhabdus sp. DH2-15 TaxID=3444112 RepID=UPI003F688CEE
MQQSATHLADYDADIIGLQEVYDPVQFKRALEKVTGKIWYMVIENKLAILAQYPIEKINLTNENILSAQVSLPSRKLTVWTLHAPKVFSRPLVNRQFFRELQDEISEKQPDAVIGDFNATRWNDGYAIMAETMKNAHKSAGLGPGSTFPASGRRSGLLGAFARIDHIFVQPELVILNAYTGVAYKLSDHHPVIADIQLP